MNIGYIVYAAGQKTIDRNMKHFGSSQEQRKRDVPFAAFKTAIMEQRNTESFCCLFLSHMKFLSGTADVAADDFE